MNDGVPSESFYILTILNDGTGFYTASDRDFPITWRIVEYNNKCYLRESGFYHYAFEQYRTFDDNLEDAHLTNSLNFYTYTKFGEEVRMSRKYTKN